jgi:endonuclease YncB( thermonuclease family)
MRRYYLFVPALVVMTACVPLAQAQTPDGERKIRNVTPENIPVIILPPRKKDDGKAAVNQAPIAGDGIVAKVSEDGVLVDGKAIKFTGTTILPSDVLCENETGGRWACGLRAYVALRNFVHGKEIKCEALQSTKDVTISRCFRDRVNVSEWILGEGWALYDEAARDEALSYAAVEAQKNARGIWANGSRPAKR